MTRVEHALSMFKEGFVCSQALLAAYGEQFGLKRETALKVAAAFGGGLCRMGETCGAVTGALMVIGLKYGNVKAKDKKAREKTYELAREFVRGFEDRNGTINCKRLLDCDISTPEGLSTAREKKLFQTVCPKYVQDAAEIVEQILK
ncbi:MAG: C_GCAxxG_C_C family protein [Deltaproteobacteria bacterium]|nr:C_GCAxxG_C_C family protein [Deltaproteobacteria bacterium]